MISDYHLPHAMDGLAIVYPPGAPARLARHHALLTEWNRNINLIGDTDFALLFDRLVHGTIHYLDEAAEYGALLARRHGRAELAARLGRNTETMRHKPQLLQLGDDVQRALRLYELPEGCAHALQHVP